MKRPSQAIPSTGKLHARLQAAMGAFLATMLALPASAGITLPTDPLQSSGRIAPNILFVLDDSGSMSDTRMPDSVPATAPTDFRNNTYARNSIFYNPASTYLPWVNSAGTLMTGGTSYGAAYTDVSFLTGSTNLQGSIQSFYVPKDITNTTNPYLSNSANYYRYQIHTDGTIYRSELLNNVSNSQGVTGRNCTNSNSGWQWKNCTRITPTGRSEADERTNFATWYSYHRTRMKVAKAGAGQAFKDLGKDVRVGFRTIWRREQGGNPVTHASPILVNRNDGLFDDPNGTAGLNNNRTLWYNRLYAASGSGTTPLHSALTDAGQYFSSATATGPYGPQAGAAQFACRQNFTILTSDGYWNGKSNYTDIAGEQDNIAGPTTITSPTGDSYTYTPELPYRAAASDTLADVAMRYWKTDLRTGLDNIVPTTAANPAFWQHMVTFGISIGEKGTLNPETDLPALTSGAISWPTPINNNIVNIDDLWHASVNGRGKFLVANNPEEFATGLKAALANIVERTGSFSNVAANSTRVDAGTQLFQASYVSGVWTGELKAYAVSTTGIADTATWSASTGIPTTGRQIFTFDGTAGTAFPTAAQTAALARPGPVAVDLPVVTGADNAAYIAGNRTLELANGGTLRNRNHLLGDIVSSSPAYDKATATIYVGANDGMLHAFNATDGAERFAYIPSGIDFNLLKTLSKPDYAHQYFVDGPITVSRRDQTPGESILVGTLGRGGKGIYALDVTTPAAFAASNVKWERTSTPGNNMGLVLGQPIIAKLNNGDMGLIVPNGINSANDRAALLIYRLSDGALLAEIDTGVGSAVAPNGLSAPTTRDLDGNGTVDYVFAGDLQGNLWKFNLSAASSTAWDNVSNRMVLFTATDAGGIRQPITSAPALARDPATFQLWVFFGTGRFMTVGDVATETVQSMYGLQDSATPITSRATELQQRRIVVAGFIDGSPVRGFEPASALTPGVRGWFIDLVTPPSPPGTPEGERIVSDAQVIANVLITSSILPSSDPCLPGGSGYINALNAFTGASLGAAFFDLDGDGIFTDEVIALGAGTVPVGSVDLRIGMPTLATIIGELLGVGGSSGGKEDVPIDLPTTSGRVSWREVIRD